MNMPVWFWAIAAFLYGISIGSFLNVVIYRLPRRKSLAYPPSYCPNCPEGSNRLKAIDLVPLFSFLALGRKCRRCHQTISWRYFNVELLTGVLFVALYLRFPESLLDSVTLMLFTSVLIPLCFIDIEFYVVLEQLSLLLFLIPLARDAWGIATHEAGFDPYWGWLPRSIVGALAGMLIFGAIRVAGWIGFKKEAMGLGDVQVARSMGAMLLLYPIAGYNPVWQLLVWMLFSCFAGILVGAPLLLLHRQKQSLPIGASDSAEEEPAEALANKFSWSELSEQLREILDCLWLRDDVDYLRYKMDRMLGKPPHPSDHRFMMSFEDDDFVPDPTAIPFVPYMAIGFLATILWGGALITWYAGFFRRPDSAAP